MVQTQQMTTTTTRTTTTTISDDIMSNAVAVHRNLTEPVLYEHAVKRDEGKLLVGGSFAVRTGARTGRSPKDKFVVRSRNISEDIWWGEQNQPMSPETFAAIKEQVANHLKSRELYVQDCHVSQDPAHAKTVRVICEQAYHSMFARTMFIPDDAPLPDGVAPELTILHAPNMHFDGEFEELNSDAVIALNFEEGIIVIAGTAYAGEMKKSVFTAMNYYLPLNGVLSLHSAANMDPRTGRTALFFGLSGTGKTTLSTDPERLLIGDDEHAWSDEGVFNIEGGCYAKVIRLSAEAEPDIFEQTSEFGTIMENVIFDQHNRAPDLDDDSLTENTRGSYPLHSLRHVYDGDVAPHPSHVILLTADATGVLPPLARLSKEQALYHFLSGYTSKLAGTETGIDEPLATFSACFGAPFMALNPTVYSKLLDQKLTMTRAQTWLVNTGWVAGPPGTGRRISIKNTRMMVRAILNNGLDDAPMRVDEVFGFEVPTAVPGVDASILSPRDMWADKEAYDRKYHELAEMYRENFRQFADYARPEVANAGPKL